MSASDSPIFIDNEWTIRETIFDPSQIVTSGSNFMTGNGYLGYRGTFPDWTAEHAAACIVSDTYDNADGRWTELCNAPNGLYTRCSYQGIPLSLFVPAGIDDPPRVSNYSLSLNFRYGRSSGSYRWTADDGRNFHLSFERFASYHNLHLVAQRVRIISDMSGPLSITTGIDGQVWNLNGDHFSEAVPFAEESIIGLLATTSEKGTPIAVAQALQISNGSERDVLRTESSCRTEEDTIIDDSGTRQICKTIELDIQAGEELVIEQMMTVFSGNDLQDPQQAAVRLARGTVESGYDREAERSARMWDSMWNRYDIQIDSSDDTQALLHYNLYHNIIATPAHTDHLPIGARGLSCQAYQGAAFWDQEIFNLPMYLYTNPEIAGRILTYRHKTLPGARRKAHRLGFEGAFYAWISGDTGDELCPDYFFKDVLTGRKIRNHFNDWQIHISMDIAYTIRQYFLATGDWEFIRKHGAEMLFEIANFIVSRAHFKKDKNRYEIIRVLGPDEYHENADNNVFTNYQAKWSLCSALEVFKRLKNGEPERIAALAEDMDLTDERIALWKEMSELMFIPAPDPKTGLIEQFVGYFSLEDILPEQLEKRLIDPDEYWGWPNGIAFETQVTKQADLLQLFCLHPDLYDSDIMKVNYEYYEPRAHHRSSLSPAVHSMVAARIGLAEQAYSYFLQSLTIDLYNTNPPASGGTFIGGIHTAACGIAWQMVVLGFAGVSVTGEGFSCDPRLPAQWSRVQFPFVYLGQEFLFTLTHDSIRIESIYSNTKTIQIRIKDEVYSIKPGSSRTVAHD